MVFHCFVQKRCFFRKQEAIYFWCACHHSPSSTHKVSIRNRIHTGMKSPSIYLPALNYYHSHINGNYPVVTKSKSIFGPNWFDQKIFQKNQLSNVTSAFQHKLSIRWPYYWNDRLKIKSLLHEPEIGHWYHYSIS